MHARGYIKVGATGAEQWYFVTQGGACTHTSDRSLDPLLVTRIRHAVAGKAPGLYRATISHEWGWAVDVGRRVAWVAAEIRRLRAKVAAPKTPARTRMPGVKGYIEAERAAQGAQENRWSETKLRLSWLLAAYPGDHTEER